MSERIDNIDVLDWSAHTAKERKMIRRLLDRRKYLLTQSQKYADGKRTYYRDEVMAIEWALLMAIENKDFAAQLVRVREIAERSDKYGKQSLAIREILALLNGLTCCKGEYNHCPECGGHRRLDEDTWVCDHCRNNKHLPALAEGR